MDSYALFRRRLSSLKGEMEKNVLLTLYGHELRDGLSSNLQRAWLVISLFFGLLFTLSAQNIWTISNILSFFVFFGTMIAVASSASSISGEISWVADSLLSKAVKRWQYILAKFASQLTLTCGIFFLVIGISFGIIYGCELFPDDLDYHNMGVIIGLCALVLIFFSAASVMFSAIFTKTLFSVTAGIMLWFVVIFLFMATTWELLISPSEILRHYYDILEGKWDIEWWKLLAFYLLTPFIFLGISLVAFYERDL